MSDVTRKAPRARSPRTRGVLDLLLLGPFTALFITREGPDYAVHSIVGLVLLIPVLVHLSSKQGWIARAWSRAGWPRKRPNSRLNAALALATTTAIITGIPAWMGASLWNAPHAVSGLASIALALTHLVRNRRKLLALLRTDTPVSAATAAAE